MFLAEVIGTVVATRKLAVFLGVKLLILQPQDPLGRPVGDAVVAADTVQAGPGERVFYVTGREAALALDEPFNPCDAAITGIVDEVQHPSVPGLA